MSIFSIILIIVGIFIALISIQAIFRTEKPLKKAFWGIFKGVAVLIAVNISGIFTGVTLPISLLSLAISILAGIPGVTALVILDMIF
ncbi:MAG: hypothetical protein RUMPE_00286 [Eubacteriales bacterium SKADARSKE-1]|nr:hypothetical protein [Eubacteriales bacterium SKADARSKE-1]